MGVSLQSSSKRGGLGGGPLDLDQPASFQLPVSVDLVLLYVLSIHPIISIMPLVLIEMPGGSY